MSDFRGTRGDDEINQQVLGIPDWTRIYGLGGDDTITVQRATVEGGRGNDTIIGSDPEFSVASYQSSKSGVVVDFRSGTVADGFGGTDTLVNIRSVFGGFFSDKFIGSGRNETVTVGAGDYFNGRGGFDRANQFRDSEDFRIVEGRTTGSWTLFDLVEGGDPIELVGVEELVFDDRIIGLGYQYRLVKQLELPVSTAPEGSSQITQMFDLNNDGLLDSISILGTFPPVDETPFPVQLFLQKPSGRFREVEIGGTPEDFVQAGHMVTSDFNGDGYLDIVISGSGYDTIPFPGETNTILLSDGIGGWIDRSDLVPQVDQFTHSVAVGDVNADGIDDIFFGNLLSENDFRSFLLISDGNGGFLDVEVPDLLLASKQDVEESVDPLASLLFDMNGDGFADLVSGGTSFGLHIFYGRDGDNEKYLGTGVQLPAPPKSDLRPVILYLDTYDFNSDGRPDLLVSNSVDYETRDLQVLVQRQDGSFVDQTKKYLVQFQSGEDADWTFSFDFGDINGDGHTDIVLSPVDVLVNDGTGRFNEAGIGAGYTDKFKDIAFYQLAHFERPGRLILSGDGELGTDLYEFVTDLGATGPNGVPVAHLGAAGFNEGFYRNTHTDVLDLIEDGLFETGLDHFLEIGKAEGRISFAPGTTVYGWHGRDSIELRNGDEIANGLGGRDTIYGRSGADTLNGDGGSDRLLGQNGKDVLNGGEGDDILKGGAGNDRINGGSGSDILFGQSGDDTLRGGASADTFVLQSGFGNDVILDFDAARGSERIDLSSLSAIKNLTDLLENHMSRLGSDVVISVGDKNSLVIRNVSILDLSDGNDFLF